VVAFRIASSSAFEGNNLGPDFDFVAGAASRAAFIASNSALVGKSLGPALFLSFPVLALFFFALLFTLFDALFFETADLPAFLGARDTGTKVPLLFC
jgi:uncharacterized membrane protein YdcZ (DUF606 family)